MDDNRRIMMNNMYRPVGGAVQGEEAKKGEDGGDGGEEEA